MWFFANGTKFYCYVKIKLRLTRIHWQSLSFLHKNTCRRSEHFRREQRVPFWRTSLGEHLRPRTAGGFRWRTAEWCHEYLAQLRVFHVCSPLLSNTAKLASHILLTSELKGLCVSSLKPPSLLMASWSSLMRKEKESEIAGDRKGQREREEEEEREKERLAGALIDGGGSHSPSPVTKKKTWNIDELYCNIFEWITTRY